MSELKSSPRPSILATLIYVLYQDEILLIHRNKRDEKQDFHSGKWNGLGGKCELDEGLAACAVRELEEESGLELPMERFRFLGFIQFPLFKPAKNEDWNVGVFVVQAAESERHQPLIQPSEGTVHWMEQSKMASLPFWPGDWHFLPFVLRGQPFHGVIRYLDGAVHSAELQTNN